MRMLKIKRDCAVCLNEKEIEIRSEACQMWLQDDRELLISGVCGACFDKLFRPEEREE